MAGNWLPEVVTLRTANTGKQELAGWQTCAQFHEITAIFQRFFSRNRAQVR